MKFLVVVAFIALVSSAIADYPKEPEEEFNKIITECRNKFKMSDEEYTRLRKGEVSNPDENMKCMANCFMEKTGILKDGKFQDEPASKIFTKKDGEQESKKILDACRGQTGTNKCDTAFKLHKCFLENKAY